MRRAPCPLRLLALALALLALAVDSTVSEVLPGVDDALFLDTLEKMPQKELKKFVRANGDSLILFSTRGSALPTLTEAALTHGWCRTEQVGTARAARRSSGWRRPRRSSSASHRSSPAGAAARKQPLRMGACR